MGAVSDDILQGDDPRVKHAHDHSVTIRVTMADRPIKAYARRHPVYRTAWGRNSRRPMTSLWNTSHRRHRILSLVVSAFRRDKTLANSTA
jgi:hypothetical protein